MSRTIYKYFADAICLDLTGNSWHSLAMTNANKVHLLKFIETHDDFMSMFLIHASNCYAAHVMQDVDAIYKNMSGGQVNPDRWVECCMLLIQEFNPELKDKPSNN